jgi:hypothetical protein
MIVYLSIGNSDDKLTQAEWSQYCVEIADRVADLAAQIHGSWFSHAAMPWQNACWCIEFRTDVDATRAREAATDVRKKYRQDSVAWAVAETEFI